VAGEIGCAAIPVTAVAGHDTASAVAAVPADGRFAFLSSGTWSLLGTELEQPIVEERALGWNFANEGGIGGTYRLLRNIMGLWLKGCRRSQARQGRWPGYEVIAAVTRDAPALQAIIDPNAPAFLNPVDMPEAIAAFCRVTGQTPPDLQSPGSVMRFMASGRIGSVGEGRALVRDSSPIRTFEPHAREGWDEAFHRFQALGSM
jgi:rhamnulokinase